MWLKSSKTKSSNSKRAIGVLEAGGPPYCRRRRFRLVSIQLTGSSVVVPIADDRAYSGSSDMVM